MVSILRKDGLLKTSRLKFLQLPDQDKEKILKKGTVSQNPATRLSPFKKLFIRKKWKNREPCYISPCTPFILWEQCPSELNSFRIVGKSSKEKSLVVTANTKKSNGKPQMEILQLTIL